MENNKILIVSPPENLYEQISKNQNFVVYKEWSFFYYNTNKNKIIEVPISKLPIGKNTLLFDDMDHDLIFSMTAVWDRWLRGSFDLKMFRDNALLNMVKIRSFLSEVSIKKAIFYTAAPHHIDTSLLSSCLAYLKVQDYYLFKIPIGGVMLFVKGSTLFSKRSIETTNLTKYQSDDDLNSFIENFKSGFAPKMNTKIKWWKTNYYSSMILGIFHLLFLSILRPKINRNTSSNHSIYRFYKDLISQKKFLSLYKSIAKNNLFINDKNFKSERKIIIAAHSQPEATTVPQGGRYSSHIDLVLKLRSIGYKDQIYYKEHAVSQIYFDKYVGPTGIGGYRSKYYLEALSSLDVAFLSYNISDLRKNDSDWIVTITSSIAIERSLQGLQTIVAGQPWYEGIPGTILIDKISVEKINSKPPPACEKTAVAAREFLKKKIGSKLSSGHIYIKQK